MLFSGRFSRRSLCSSGWPQAVWPGCVELPGHGVLTPPWLWGSLCPAGHLAGSPSCSIYCHTGLSLVQCFRSHQTDCSITGALGLVCFFWRALCVRSFEMLLHRHSLLELDEQLFLTFQALCSLFSAYNSAPGTAWEFSPVSLLTLPLQLSTLAFSCDLLFCLAALAQSLRAAPVTWTAQVLLCECLLAFLVFSCCSQAAELLPAQTPQLWNAGCAPALDEKREKEKLEWIFFHSTENHGFNSDSSLKNKTKQNTKNRCI